MERKGLVQFQENALTLIGTPLEIGTAFPDVLLSNSALEEVQLSSYFGTLLVISTGPSLDTPTCQIQTQTLDTREGFGPDTKTLTISNDLPFAQQRYCTDKKIESVEVLSDYRGQKFGLATGLLIKELNLLARSVTVIDAKGIIRYHQLVADMAQEPDYDEILTAIREAGVVC